MHAVYNYFDYQGFLSFAEFSLYHQTRTTDNVLNRLASLVGNFLGQTTELSDMSKSGEKQAVFTVCWRKLQSFYTCASDSNFSYHLTPLATIGDQIVDTLFLNGVYSFREQNNPQPPLSPPFKAGVFVVFYK